jgi:hypothetical protein
LLGSFKNGKILKGKGIKKDYNEKILWNGTWENVILLFLFLFFNFI